MRIITYNVNGIRAALKKGLIEWMQAAQPDVLCLQEIKLDDTALVQPLFEDLGYHCYWHPAIKKGYSGVAILSKVPATQVSIGCGTERYDCEGRYLRAQINGVSVMSVYLPSGTSGDERQTFKFECMEHFYDWVHCVQKEEENLILCGDFNICHRPIDIHNPKSNAKSSGFLPEERDWMEKLISSGFIDSFRHFNQDPHHYTWWSQRFNSREKNLGWRIDYALASQPLKERLTRALILPEAKHSDHCPVLLEVAV